MTPVLASPPKPRPLSREPKTTLFVNDKFIEIRTRRNVKLVPALTRQQCLSPLLPTRHRGAQAVTSAAPGQAPKLLEQVSNFLHAMHSVVEQRRYSKGGAHLEW